MRSRMLVGRPVSRNRRTGCARSVQHGPANNGATVAQLNALFGWTGSKMASLYAQSGDRKRLAQDAIAMLANELQRLSPHLAIR
jgi:hypothetical protein